MSDKICKEFQDTVSEYLIRHKSIIDVMSKLQEATAHVNRAISKAVTSCGCLKIKASKQPIPKDATLSEISEYVRTHLEGKLCPNCLEAIEAELGNTMFYLAATCTLLDLDLEKIITHENNRISTLGVYSLT
ncbi:hypothetical protein [Candidatus Oleimmundimicrobium sp.]|uniref:hypothetical protein n=1 Tax=Candidatus Oleimmundimicrobium sp. TaxID=3060597 RepID=UPI002716B46D|nr:hypothetical protein [Candidatus Oleimmundimicrobium sp.]MDO8885981.1 hypothetical protein [Candidatus Oleimmundimicrobium sp.]